jgi:hypothetical protein
VNPAILAPVKNGPISRGLKWQFEPIGYPQTGFRILSKLPLPQKVGTRPNDQMKLFRDVDDKVLMIVVLGGKQDDSNSNRGAS